MFWRLRLKDVLTTRRLELLSPTSVFDGGQNVDVYEAITTRKMVSAVESKAPSRAEIERLLAAAVRAPTHHLTEPWRFIVIAGAGLDDLGDAMAMRVRAQFADSPELDQKLELEKSRPKRAPVIVVVIYVPSTHPKAIEIEDRHSIGAAMQNLLLAAHGMGLGAYLRTGPAAFDENVRRFLQLDPGEEIAGFIYLGYPAPGQPDSRSIRSEISERTRWVGWD